MQLFYSPSIESTTRQIVFNREESRHIVRVLRKKGGDTLHITNGKGFLFSANVDFANEKKCTASIVNMEQKKKHWNYYLHIAIAPTKNIDRLEWFLEKATEIGIDEITPIICQNSERRIVKTERLQRILQSAMKQSLKFTLPRLNEPTKFSDFLKTDLGKNSYIAHCEPSDKQRLKNIILNSKTTILIGPEGDFSSEEIKLSKDKNLIPITLGKSRLRTETAGLVAVQNVSFLHQQTKM